MRHPIPIAALLLALSMFACVKETVNSTSTENVSATVLFPPNVSCTDADSITVRGVSSGNFESLEIDGVGATTSDGFRTWAANVPITNDLNTFTLVGFRDGHTPDFNLDSISITKDLLVGARIHDLCLSSEWGYMYAFAENPDLGTPPAERYALLSIDPTNGRTQLVTGWSVGSGLVLSPNIRAMAASAAQAAVFIVDAGMDAVIKVDKVNGHRSTFSSASIGEGPTIEHAKAMCISDQHESIYILDEALDAVIAVSLVTADRTLVSGDDRGSGPSLQGARDITFDMNRGMLLISSSQEDGILQVDINSGTRTLIAGLGIGEGPPLPNLTYLRYNRNLDEILGYEQSSATLLSIDVETGSRFALDSFEWCDVSEFVFDTGTSLAWMHTKDGVIFSYDKVTGETALLGSHAYPGPGISIPTAGPMTYDSTRAQTVFFGRGPTGSGLRALSSYSGAEFVLDAYYPPSEPTPAAITFDARRDHVLILREGNSGLYGLGLSTGDMSYISGPGDLGNGPAGSGPSLFQPSSIASGPGTRFASVLDPGSPNGVYLIDQLNGDRELISSTTSGFGPLWSTPTDITTAPEEDSLWVCDENARIYAVDTETGARSLLGEYKDVAGVNTLTHLLCVSELSLLYALDTDTGTILKVNTASGLASAIYGPQIEARGLHMKPTNWALKPETGTLILMTDDPAALVEFDPLTSQGVTVAR
jgi:hypothetical protein